MAALKGQRHCFTHSPRTANARRVARRKGGLLRGVGKAQVAANVGSLEALQRHLGFALADVQLLGNSERRGGVLARLILTAAKLIEVGDIESRLESVEQQLTALETQG